MAQAQAGMAKLFQKEARLDSALFYARKSLRYFQNNKLTVQTWGENSNTYIAEISIVDITNEISPSTKNVKQRATVVAHGLVRS